MTRLLREHPPIDAELDSSGALVAFRWNGRREPVEVCNRWRVEESWWSQPIAADYFKVAGPRWLALIYLDRVDGSWHWSACTTDPRNAQDRSSTPPGRTLAWVAHAAQPAAPPIARPHRPYPRMDSSVRRVRGAPAHRGAAGSGARSSPLVERACRATGCP